MDRRLPNFICAARSSRRVLLMLFISSTCRRAIVFHEHTDISSGLLTGIYYETSGHKRSAFMALLLHREVLALPVTLDISHARAIARASADLLKVLHH